MAEDRTLRNIASETKAGFSSVASSISDGSKTIGKGLDNQIGKLSKRMSDTFALQAVELLTKPEIEELRKLVSLERSEASKYASLRVEDPAIRGMYSQLSDIGFIICVGDFSGGLHFVDVSPKANWAISRYDAKIDREKVEAEERAHQRRNDRLFNIGSLFLGWFLGLLTSLVTVLISLTLG